MRDFNKLRLTVELWIYLTGWFVGSNYVTLFFSMCMSFNEGFDDKDTQVVVQTLYSYI